MDTSKLREKFAFFAIGPFLKKMRTRAQSRRSLQLAKKKRLADTAAKRISQRIPRNTNALCRPDERGNGIFVIRVNRRVGDRPGAWNRAQRLRAARELTLGSFELGERIQFGFGPNGGPPSYYPLERLDDAIVEFCSKLETAH